MSCSFLIYENGDICLAAWGEHKGWEDSGAAASPEPTQRAVSPQVLLFPPNIAIHRPHTSRPGLPLGRLPPSPVLAGSRGGVRNGINI